MNVVRFLSVLFFVMFQAFSVFSQSIDRFAYVSAASFNEVNSISLQSNIGEIASSTYINSSALLTQGFIQPEPMTITFTDEYNRIAELKIFPNPVTSKFFVEFLMFDNSDFVITIYDILGKKISTDQYSTSVSKNKLEFNFEKIESGLYFINFSSQKNNFNKTVKIIKN